MKKKKNALKKCLIFQEKEISSPKLKNLLYFRGELAKPENQKFHIFCFLRQDFSHIRTQKQSYTFPYKEAKFFK